MPRAFTWVACSSIIRASKDGSRRALGRGIPQGWPFDNAGNADLTEIGIDFYLGENRSVRILPRASISVRPARPRMAG
jgi:hypothetical protein